MQAWNTAQQFVCFTSKECTRVEEDEPEAVPARGALDWTLTRRRRAMAADGMHDKSLRHVYRHQSTFLHTVMMHKPRILYIIIYKTYNQYFVTRERTLYSGWGPVRAFASKHSHQSIPDFKFLEHGAESANVSWC